MPTTTPNFLTKASVESVLILTVVSLVLVQMISFGISAVFPQVAIFKVGVGFLMLTIGTSILLPYVIIRQKAKAGSLTQIGWADMSILVVVFVMTYVLMTGLPQWIPQIFSIQDISAFNQNALSIISTMGR